MRHVLHDVRVGGPPLSDSLGKQSEVWRKQDDIGRLAGNIRAAVDGKPNIGGMDGGRVVDAVPDIADDMTPTAKGAHDPALLVWRRACENVCLGYPSRQRGIAQHLGKQQGKPLPANVCSG